MIYEPKSALVIPKIVALAEKYLPNSRIDVLKRYVSEAFSNPNVKLFVYERGGDIHSYIVSSIEWYNGDNNVFIQSCVISPDNAKNIGFEIFARVRLWAKELGLKTIYTITDRNPRPYMRKYKFKYHASILKREVDE